MNMPAKVKITKFESGFANVPARFEVGDHDDWGSHLVSCQEYVLPDGYHVSETVLGDAAIYDDADQHREIVEHNLWKHGGKCLCSNQ